MVGVHEIGVDVDDFQLRPRDALRRAADLLFRTVELSAASDDVSPASLTAGGRRHLLKYMDGLGLLPAAITGDLPGLRFTDAGTVDERVSRTCEILQLAADLKAPVVTASVGALIHPQSGEPSGLAREALHRVGEFAESRGVIYAIRPSHDSGEGAARLLRGLSCPSLRVGMDPAMLVMTGANPQAVIERLAGEISLIYARDGTQGGTEQTGRETRLGEGDVDWVGVLRAINDADYSGPFILRRTDSPTPSADLESGRKTLSRLMGVSGSSDE